MLTKVCIVKAMVFPVVMYICQSWSIKKAEHQRTDAFKLWCWKRFLRLPWTARRSNQLILKEINPEFSLEGFAEAEAPMLWLPDAKSWFIGKDPDAGKDEGQKERERQHRMRWLCCRKGHPFQGPKLGSCLTLGNELSEETHVLTKQEILLGTGTRVESRRVREPRRTARPCGS